MKEEKRRLRREVADRRNQLTGSYLEASDKEIADKIIKLKEFQRADTVFCFVGTKEEINTLPIIKEALEKGKCLAVPKCIGPGVMKAYQITSMDQLQSGAYGILEPDESCLEVKKEDIAFALVPCVSCDKEGNRLGYGGGYYDRYMKGTSFTTAVICRELLMCEQIPLEPWDQKMDYLVTEQQVWFFSK